MAKITDLSKTRYCKGIQCPKILWLDAYKPEEAENVLSETVMANGNLVGDLARNYFGAYSLVEFSYNKTEMTEKTQTFIRGGAENIAEASFLYDGLYCAVDILHRNGDGWDIVEVKSSTHLTDIYLEDGQGAAEAERSGRRLRMHIHLVIRGFSANRSPHSFGL